MKEKKFESDFLKSLYEIDFILVLIQQLDSILLD